MGKTINLRSVYKKLVPDVKTLFVIPLIRYEYPKSDYLYLFYKDLIESNDPPEVKSISVFGHLKFVFSALAGNSSIVHYHWLEFQDKRALLGMIYKWICLFMYKLSGGKLVWTIHNKMPHNKRYYKKNFLLRKWMARKADILHVHCETAADEMSEFFNIPRKKFVVIPHPKFPAKLIPHAAAAEAINQRFDLNLKGTDSIFLNFGNISTYKGIAEIARIFKTLDPNKKLIIAGPVKKGHMHVYKELKTIQEDAENICIIPQFISEECVAEFFNAADYAVFNYHDILTSGGVELARSYRKKIILPLTGCLKELEGLPNVIPFKTSEELKDILQNT
jgi:glycosyltransferase involved in cell wall biosynthesis